MENKTLLLTFDYELFLGPKSGSVEKCLIQPTNEILAILERNKLKSAIFFVDTTYLIRLKDQETESCHKDYKRIVLQIQKIVSSGHYVFPHLHPHWIDAEYNSVNNEWKLYNYSRYRFHKAEQEERRELFEKSIDILKEIILPVASDYVFNGYRAGGWSIQPFADFIPYFKQYGITNEFSVVPGFVNRADVQYFDFSEAPKKEVYRFTNDPCSEIKGGPFTEYTISTLVISPTIHLLNRIWNKYLWKTGQRSIGDGIGVAIKEESASDKRKETLGSGNCEMVSLELLTLAKMSVYKRFISNNQYMHFISHPKMLSQHNLKMFDRFIKYAVKRFDLQTDFKKLTIN